LEALAKQLNLSPQQKMQLLPILEADAPKIQAIKNNTSLGPLQKMEQMKAVHAQSDPQIKSILNPQQYEQFQQIRQQEIQAAMQKRMGQQEDSRMELCLTLGEAGEGFLCTGWSNAGPYSPPITVFHFLTRHAVTRPFRT
jgi:hypothetical protein